MEWQYYEKNYEFHFSEKTRTNLQVSNFHKRARLLNKIIKGMAPSLFYLASVILVPRTDASFFPHFRLVALTDRRSTAFYGKSRHSYRKSAEFYGKSRHLNGKSTAFYGKSRHFNGKSTAFYGESMHFNGKSTVFYGKSGHFHGNSLIIVEADISLAFHRHAIMQT